MATNIFHLLYYIGFLICYILKNTDTNLFFSEEEEICLPCGIRDLGKGFWRNPKVQRLPGCVLLEFTELIYRPA